MGRGPNPALMQAARQSSLWHSVSRIVSSLQQTTQQSSSPAVCLLLKHNDSTT
jgi:hypothetical protein